MSSPNTDTIGCSSAALPPCHPFSSLKITIADDNARGHQSPETFEIVEGNTKKQQVCISNDCPVVAICRWGTSDSAQKQRSSPCSPCRKRSSSTSSSCLPKRPTRRRADSLDDSEGLDTDSNHSAASTGSRSSCSSICSSSSSGDVPLRRPRRRSSLESQKRCPLSSESAAATSAGWRRCQSGPCRFAGAKEDNADACLPPLMLWSRSYISARQKIAAGAHTAKPRMLPAPGIRRRKQIFSQSA